MLLPTIARQPLVVVSPDDTIMHAIEATLPPEIGAVAVVEDGRMVGIFTERDVMLKVVHQRRDPDTTRVGDLMTKNVVTVRPDTPPREVLRTMLQKKVRHLPISEDGQVVTGMLSIQDLLFYIVEELSTDLQHLEAFLGADSPGG